MAEANKAANSGTDPRIALMNKVSKGAKEVIAKNNPDSATAKALKASEVPTAAPKPLKKGVPSTPAAVAAAKGGKTAAKPAPAKVAKVAKTTPATEKGAKPPKAVKAPAAKAAPSATATQVLVVAPYEGTRKGEMAEYVAVAAKMKKGFTRDQLHTAMVNAGKDAKAARIKIADGVYFKIFVAA